MLACIAAIGVAFYSVYGRDSVTGKGYNNFFDILDSLWLNIGVKAKELK